MHVVNKRYTSKSPTAPNPLNESCDTCENPDRFELSVFQEELAHE